MRNLNLSIGRVGCGENLCFARAGSRRGRRRRRRRTDDAMLLVGAAVEAVVFAITDAIVLDANLMRATPKPERGKITGVPRIFRGVLPNARGRGG